MDKIIILQNGNVVNEIGLDKQQMVIGRDEKNAIHLGDPSVSRRHALLSCALDEYFIEDLGSTNGTLLNDRPVTKHILKSGDLLRIGEYVLSFERSATELIGDDDDPEKTQVIRTAPPPPPPPKPKEAPLAPKTAILKYFRGPKKGESEKIDRSLYTLGKPGGDVAVIARRSQGFYLMKIGNSSVPTINDKKVDVGGGIKLHEGDRVQVGENAVEISFAG
jgi:pSer/pThr/pTyr-binding forkhead associated (FHA) protein